MARLQILELPEGAGDDRAPFILVVDEWRPSSDPDVDRDLSVQLEGTAERIGARGILVFEETVEIPANVVPVDTDGHPIRFHVEGDFTQFRQQLEAEIVRAQERLKTYIRS